MWGVERLNPLEFDRSLDGDLTLSGFSEFIIPRFPR
jgi:hypothetical protein